jgi:hypothetical protein
MDDVERMYRHLVRTIKSTSPQLLTQPFQVADLYATILPYRLHRRDLGLETNQDYEMAMLELLSGGRGYLVVENRMREVLGESLRSPNPDPQLIREFASSRVALAPEALQQLEPDAAATLAATSPTAPTGSPVADTGSTRRPRAAESTVAAPSGVAAPPPAPARAATRPDGAPSTSRATGTSASAPASGSRRASRPITVSPTGETCPHCKGELPAGREINFCPHCGQDLTVRHCPACGSELEHEWKFCVTCGRAVGAG